MKKALCVFLAAALLLAAAPALAEISVSWADGTLTVSTTDTVGMNIILIDGEETGKYVGDTSPSQTFSVPEDGKTHRVTTIPYFGANGGSASFVAGGAPVVELPEDWDEGEVTLAPTCEEDGAILYTDKNHPDKTRTEIIPALGHQPETIPGTEPTCTETGLTDGEQCAVCGEILKAQETIPALGHDYVEQTASLTVKELTCSRCGAAAYTEAYDAIRNLYGGILRNARGENVDYDASYDVLSRDTLIITALVDQEDESWVSQIGMYLSDEVIALIQAEAFGKVCFVNEDAQLTFALADLTAELFGADQVDEYVITLDPRAEDGCLVSLEAAVAEDQRIAAESFGPMQLTLNDTVLDVSKPGTYSE